jgi:zinc protease
VIVEVPAADHVSVPTEGDVRRVLASAIERPVQPYVERRNAAALIGEMPPPGMVTSESTFRGAGITEWRLSNGARVLLKPTKSGDNSILFNAWAPRGTRQALPGEAASARYASEIAAASGLGALSRGDLTARLNGTTAKIEALIAPTSTLLQGEAQPADVSTLMELIYSTFTAPRLDSAAWVSVKHAEAEALHQAAIDPDAAFEEGADSLLAQYSLRDSPATPLQLSAVDLARARTFYRRTFADPSIFTFVFAGPLDQASLKPLVERYLAALPHVSGVSGVSGSGSRPPSYPTGVTSVVISKGIEQRSQTRLVFADSSANTPAEHRMLNALVATLQLQLDAVIRERLGLAYNPHAEAHTAPNVPYPGYEVTVDYGSAPSRADETTNRILGLIRSLQAQGPSAAEVASVQRMLVHEYETESSTSAFWLGNITAHVALGQNVGSVGIDERPRIEELTRDAIRDAARRYLSTTAYFKIVLYPGGKH